MQLRKRFDRDIDAEHMRDPALHRLRQCVEPFAAGRQIERHVELVAAVPITVGIVMIDDIDLSLRRNAKHRNQRRDRRSIDATDRFLVSRNQ